MTAWDALCCWLLIPVAWGWRQVERRGEQVSQVWSRNRREGDAWD